jgi:hypothetical protein
MTAAVSLVLGVILLGATLSACSGGPIPTDTQQTVGESACVPNKAEITPVSWEWVRVWTSQALTVHKSMFVGLQVTEPEAYTTTKSFPWGAQVISTGGVLTPAKPCHSAPPATVPLAVYYFRAINAGSTTVIVPLSKSCLARVHSCLATASCVPLLALRVLVTVTDD